MSEQERCKKIALMCREILDTDEPFYWHLDLPDKEKDYTIDFLLRAVLGFAEMEDDRSSLKYAENKFYAAYNKITNKRVHPKNA
ncbi:hypothetical protein ACW2QC_07350 [Virgibacillus sp. FSP13]